MPEFAFNPVSHAEASFGQGGMALLQKSPLVTCQELAVYCNELSTHGVYQQLKYFAWYKFSAQSPTL